ncbi:MAG: hypothetical protein MUP36_03525 [Demequinaceae bacterium]|nr:hypothetical protein [Demequinaceae bacterium]
MFEKKRVTRAFAILAGASMFALAGPAALADDDATGTPSPEPTVVGDNGATGENCVIVVRPEKTQKNGKVIPEKTRVSSACVQAKEQKRIHKEERAQLREEIKAAGGSWGVMVRQETMVKVATKLAERGAQAPNSAALGQILSLINYGLPEQLKFDIEGFCAQYDLVFEDLIPADDEGDDEIESSSSPSV